MPVQSSHSAEILRAIIESSPDPIAAQDAEGRYIAFNEAYRAEFERIFGRPVSVGRTAYEVLAGHPEDLGSARYAFERARRGERFTIVQQYGDPARARETYEITFGPIYDADSRTLGVVQIIRNATGKARYEAWLADSKLELQRLVSERTAELEASRERLALAQQAGGVGVFDWDLRTGRAVWSEQLEALFGLEPGEFEGDFEGWARRVHPDEAPRLEAMFREAMDAGRRELEFEYRFLKRGEVRWMQARAHIHYDDEGRAVRMIGTNLDVTDRKRAEEALRRSEETYRSIARHFPGGAVYVFDRDMRIVTAEGPAMAMVGLPKEQVEGRTIWEIDTELAKIAEPRYRRTLAGETLHFVNPVRGRIFSTHYVPLRQEDGEVLAGLVVAQDVTEQKRAEASLRESEERFRTLANNIAQLAWMADENGSLFWFNARWFEYTGTTLEQMQGAGWREVHHPDHVDRVTTSIGHSFATGEPWEDTFPLRGRSGEYRWFLSRAVPIRDENGRVLRWFGTHTDITGQRETEERLRESEQRYRDLTHALQEADRRKDDFLAVLSHELRNPLAPIKNGLYILEQAPPDSSPARRAREVMNRQVGQLTRLIDDLLDVTRITRGKIQLKRERVDLVDLVAQTVEDYRDTFAAGQVHLEAALPDAPVVADGDPIRLAQVVGNLLQNAAKFTSAGGSTTVRLERADGTARIRVKDTGLGIDPEILPNLFEPFIQASQTLERSRGGLGLGLALVKGLVELHGGEVSVESLGPGEGAEFVITLPAEAEAPDEAAEAGGPERAPAGRRVLVIEDNLDAAESLRDALELGGHEVEVAYSGAEGLEKAGAFLPDAVVCDIGLPGIDGYEVARTLRRDPRLGRTLLVALTGYALPEDVAKAEAAGFDRHLAKPPDLAALEQLLAAGRPA